MGWIWALGALHKPELEFECGKRKQGESYDIIRLLSFHTILTSPVFGNFVVYIVPGVEKITRGQGKRLA